MGAQVTFEGRAWQVTGLVDGRVHLAARAGATGCVLATHLVSAPGFSVTGPPAAEPPAPALWETVPLAAQERALAWLRHIREVETGLPGAPGSAGLLHAIGWADAEHTLRPFDETVRRRTGRALARRVAGAPPGSETTGGSGEAGRTADVAAEEGIAGATMAYDGSAGDRVARDTGGSGMYDPQAEAELW